MYWFEAASQKMHASKYEKVYRKLKYKHKYKALLFCDTTIMQSILIKQHEMQHKTQLNITDDKTNKELWECQFTVWSVKCFLYLDFWRFLKILIIFTSFVTPRIFCCMNIWTCKIKNRDCFKKNWFFYQHLNVGKFHEKMLHLTKSGEMLILVGFKRWSKHRWNRLLLKWTCYFTYSSAYICSRLFQLPCCV